MPNIPPCVVTKTTTTKTISLSRGDIISLIKERYGKQWDIDFLYCEEELDGATLSIEETKTTKGEL